ncbi:MAG: alpha-L-fucosidase [Bryobacterales bacterium]|nr:alpha-L-fucosidase [Bryobacterales bacterium]
MTRVAALLLLAASVLAADDRLQQRLEWFQDQKFGLMLHWGAYSQMGVIESWPLVWADRKWSNPKISTREEMVEFRKRYFALPRTFNPTEFDPAVWARHAKAAGMRYVVFTTKHHDGFAMFDTRQSEYRVTAPEVTFSRDPRSNIVREVFSAFRKQGLGIGAYFSKSDWHSPFYWRPDVFAEDRNPNYDTLADSRRWAQFVQFVHGQIGELVTGYGPIDILWLDGGQVRPPKQNIDMDRLVAMARRHQPGLIVVDRTVGGKHENYRTPEQKVPQKPLDGPWESCITMGTQWSYKPADTYKPARELVHLLVDVVAKGGNLLLNIGPQPDGQLPEEAVVRLEEIGRWMAVNGKAIHGTRAFAPYREGRIAYTRRGNTIYAFYLLEHGERPPSQIVIPAVRPGSGTHVELLGSRASVEWSVAAQGITIRPPDTATAEHAIVFAISGTL